MERVGHEYSAARQKFWEALQGLVSSLPMRRRLGQALESLAQLDPDKDVPPEMKQEFERLLT